MAIATEEQKMTLSQAIEIIANSGADLSTLFKENGIMNQLKRGLVEKALQAEIQEHLGFQKHERNPSNNARNGKSTKTLFTESGPLEIEVPRDREGTFEPLLVPKRVTRVEGLDEKVISLYAKGLSITDIQTQLQELYGGAEVSTALISRITDSVLEEVTAWQNRALDKTYAIVYFDCLVVKVKQDRKIINKAVYIALGITLSGHKEVLGLWINETEGAKFWLANLTELKNRGLQDILIACTDGLTGLSEAINSAYPKTEHQLCIVHQTNLRVEFSVWK